MAPALRLLLLLLLPLLLAAAVTVAATPPPSAPLPVAAFVAGIDADNTAVYYPLVSSSATTTNATDTTTTVPLLLVNDGGAANGGFHVWPLPAPASPPPRQRAHRRTGRSKLVLPLYRHHHNNNDDDDDDDDVILTLSQPDSRFRSFDTANLLPLPGPPSLALGDWSAWCRWTSAASAESYVYLFGKHKAVMYLVRGRKGRQVELVQVQSFDTPIEADSCAVSASSETVYFATHHSNSIYRFKALESIVNSQIDIFGELEDPTGLATYFVDDQVSYLLAAQKDVIGVYTESFEHLGSLALTGIQDIEVEGLAIYQAASGDYPAGALTYAFESNDSSGFAVSSLESAFTALNLSINTAYDPRHTAKTSRLTPSQSPVCDACSQNGFCTSQGRLGDPRTPCSCFAGFASDTCDQVTCLNDCSSHGKCIGANQCQCSPSWAGPDCSFLVVTAKYETDANGGDGDDPAIWISPISRNQSRIITTTKSERGAGLAVFDLRGKRVQTFPAGEPNNVDVIYSFPLASNKTVDLAFAACRADNTLCLFEITSTGELRDIPGGIQPTKPNYKVYGSCVYRSPKTSKQYLFVNAKTAEYLQYELTATSNGTLQTTLIRSFTGGSGGQVEGCVVDEPNSYLWLGEEPSALWRYDAEPDDTNPTPTGLRVAFVGDSTLHADVEGVTLVEGSSLDKGFVLVSNQGVSAYTIYRRAPPHEYVTTFTIAASADGLIDHVSNTDGITAVGTALSPDFPNGLIVVHDDVNELPVSAGGGTSDEASFKLVSLADVLDADALKSLKLLADVDPNWDPRMQLQLQQQRQIPRFVYVYIYVTVTMTVH